jgi:transcriptional regulator with XRE-family HTH domain
MVSGRRPDVKRRRQAARLRARGLSLAEVGRRLGVSKQGAAVLLRPLRQAPVVACARCGAAIVSAGALPSDAGQALCLACLEICPGATHGERLRAFRLAAGLMKLELARKAAMPEMMVRRLEQGRHRPRLTTLHRLARALGIPRQALDPGGLVPGYCSRRAVRIRPAGRKAPRGGPAPRPPQK